MMHLAIDRAYREGTGLIVEGVNVIPGLTLMNYKELRSVVLFVEDKTKHYEMINGDTHVKRHVSKQQFNLVRDIQSVLLNRATKYNWPAIDVTKESGEHELKSCIL
jgi:2-phosphoglycerate kinase